MKKTLKNLLLAVLLLASIITLSGCGKDKEEDTKKEDESNKDPIVGVWAYGSFKYTFNEDNECLDLLFSNIEDPNQTIESIINYII